MIREVAEIAIVIGIAVTGVAVAVYQHGAQVLDKAQKPVPVVERVETIPVPPPPPAIEADAPQDIVEPIQAVGQIEQHLEQIQERLDRIEKKADEGKK